MNWKTKATLFRVLSLLPFGGRLHYQLQRHITHEWPRPVGVLDELLTAAKRVFLASAGHHGDFLEIGAGRDLAVAVALRLLGVRHVTCVDVSHLARPELIAFAASHMAMRLGVPAPSIQNWHDVEAFGITYLAPMPLQQAALQPGHFDCFFSIDTLEHIPHRDLENVLKEASRLLRSDGLHIHCIDYGDHYARGNGGLSRFNFLTYTERGWRPYNSPFQYVNRLRHSDYLKLFAEAGMQSIAAQPDHSPPEQPIMDQLAPEFQSYATQDLFTIRAMVVAARQGVLTATDGVVRT